jgi:hypothetical protein
MSRAASMSRWRSTLTALRDREATPRRFKTCTLKVFNYDEDGGLTSRSEYLLKEIPLTVLVSLFEQITAVLPFEQWGRLYYYEQGNAFNRQLVYERITHNDQDFVEYMKTLLDGYAGRINSSPARMCFQLHKRFP